ncbi:hypothetical protein L198_02103 [Cryptococcus wingfieldii CBS 7118]|uniref:Uncharacterized protein n=1 Tax=Cryptococcus wingfieldii CBS 7118 TaxID=1295528 RepID=A0A1E3JX49_9TREE|nr:hypothetical protein L198_02103 [Cryptococcus wingfieldii CBS 7118]ODO05410.1 hypothetical protein L198_02103 [Cryptococcus wingfieldii CBS 7118]
MKPDTSTEASSKPESTGTATQTSFSNPPGATTNDRSRMAPFWSQYRLQIPGQPEEIQFLPSDRLDVAETVRDISRAPYVVRELAFNLDIDLSEEYLVGKDLASITYQLASQATADIPLELAPSILEEMSFFVNVKIPPVLQGRVQDLTAVSQDIIEAPGTTLHNQPYFIPGEENSEAQDVRQMVSAQYFEGGQARGSTTIYTGYERRSPNDEQPTITSMVVPTELAPSVLTEMAFYVGSDLCCSLSEIARSNMSKMSESVVQAQFTKIAAEKMFGSLTGT